jgi:hypothetical protein
LVRHRSEDLNIYCKAWPVRNRGGRFAKTAFVVDWQAQTITCPNQVSVPLQVRQRQLTPLGRAKLRERTAVEHSLAPKRTLARPSLSLHRVTQEPI